MKYSRETPSRPPHHADLSARTRDGPGSQGPRAHRRHRPVPHRAPPCQLQRKRTWGRLEWQERSSPSQHRRQPVLELRPRTVRSPGRAQVASRSWSLWFDVKLWAVRGRAPWSCRRRTASRWYRVRTPAFGSPLYPRVSRRDCCARPLPWRAPGEGSRVCARRLQEPASPIRSRGGSPSAWM